MLKETLKKDEIAAMKARDKARVSVLRLVNSEIKSFEVNNRENISDENVIKIVEKSIKQNYTSKDMGNIMKEIMPKVNGKFDRSKINPMVKEILG